MRSALLLLVVMGGCSSRDPGLPATGDVPWPGEHESFTAKHERFLAEGRAEKFDVICLGDSLTWGWDNHRELWRDAVTSARTAFWAIGGDATNQLLWRIDHGALDGQSPAVVVLLVGTNNSWIDDNPADIARSIHVVVQRIARHCPHSMIMLLGILPQGDNPGASSRAKFTALNRLLPMFASKHVRVLPDIGNCLLEADGTLSSSTSYDGTHLTETGYRRFAAALAPHIRAVLSRE